MASICVVGNVRYAISKKTKKIMTGLELRRKTNRVAFLDIFHGDGDGV